MMTVDCTTLQDTSTSTCRFIDDDVRDRPKKKVGKKKKKIQASTVTIKKNAAEVAPHA